MGSGLVQGWSNLGVVGEDVRWLGAKLRRIKSWLGWV